jgi:drug/metabolite transporter (DMT)-like permease
MTPYFGILLALACALTTNVGFLLKHRGACEAPAVDMRRPLWSAKGLFASRYFAIGMLVACVAWIFHVAALAVAPLSLVQTVLAAGVVLLAFMADRVFGLRICRRQWIGLGLTAAGLIMLGLSLPAVKGAHSHFSLPGMIAFEAGLIIAGSLLIMGPRMGASTRHYGFMLGAAAGILFGVSDVAIKAISGMVGSEGVIGLVSPWTLITVLVSIAAFYASAKGLQNGDPVPVIAVTGTAANVAGIVGGIIVFGDPLSAHPVTLAIECLAFVLVIFAAWLTPAPLPDGASGVGVGVGVATA